jgi:hypothetical protein
VRKKLPFSFSANVYHKIATNDYSLLHPDRVPGFIKSEFSEIFKDCQTFHLDFDHKLRQSPVTCDDCVANPWRRQCRGKQCSQLFDKFLQQFRAQIVQKSEGYI